VQTDFASTHRNTALSSEERRYGEKDRVAGDDRTFTTMPLLQREPTYSSYQRGGEPT